MECSFETKWCKSTPKNFQPLAKDKKPNNRGQLQSVQADCSCQKHRVEKFVKGWECEGVVVMVRSRELKM